MTGENYSETPDEEGGIDEEHAADRPQLLNLKKFIDSLGDNESSDEPIIRPVHSEEELRAWFEELEAFKQAHGFDDPSPDTDTK